MAGKTALIISLTLALGFCSALPALAAPGVGDRMVEKFVVYNNDLIEASRPVITGTRAVISTGNWNASLVGYDIMKKGGNAFDIGVAAAAALKVTKMHYAGWCGISPFIGYNAKEKTVACYAGVGVAPKAATPEFYRSLGYDIIPPDKPFLTALTPSEPDTYIAILQRWGTLSLTECLQGALELAERGFPAFKFHVSTCQDEEAMALLTDYNRSYWLQYGRAPKPGELIVNKDLGKTFRIMIEAEQKALKEGKSRVEALEAARNAFYKGEIAKAIAAYFQENGGLMTYEDLANYRGKWYDPIMTTYKGVEVYGTPTWTQCGLVIQYLNMLENFDIQKLGYNTPQYIHLISQIINLGMADRNKYYGDPDFVDVPKELWSKEYARERVKLIDLNKAMPGVPPPGDPKNLRAVLAEAPQGKFTLAKADQEPEPETDTTYLCVIDDEGNVFSMTPSDGHVSSPMIPGYGFGLATRMTQFDLDPERASLVAPGKKPMVTPNPILALKDGKPLFALGTPGGDQQAQSMLQVFLNWYEWGMDPQQALDQPRFGSYNFPSAFSPYTYYPGRLSLEARIPKETGEALAAMGHKLTWWPKWTPLACAPCFVVRDPGTGLIMGGADVRRECYAVGW